MQLRVGVSLVEVLVAAVLLAVGVSGALSALTGAARLRTGAALRERVAEAAEARLSWFEGRACLLTDTVVTSAPGALVNEGWQVRRDSSAVEITGRARAVVAARSFSSGFEVRLRC